MSNISEGDWKRLIEKIKDGRCTPFIGAGACAGVFPLGAEIAAQWAQEHSYPLQRCAETLSHATLLTERKANLDEYDSPKKGLNHFVHRYGRFP
jgi:hypothetical protein